MASACAYLPGRAGDGARRSRCSARLTRCLMVHVSCGGSLLASDGLCADVVMKDGSRLRFERVGLQFLRLDGHERGGRQARAAWCRGSPPAPASARRTFIAAGAIGHHFSPTLIDVKDAVFRYREVLEEVEFWPQCPQYWEVQDQRGENYALLCASRPRHRGAAAAARLQVGKRLVVRQRVVDCQRRDDHERRRYPATSALSRNPSVMAAVTCRARHDSAATSARGTVARSAAATPP